MQLSPWLQTYDMPLHNTSEYFSNFISPQFSLCSISTLRLLPWGWTFQILCSLHIGCKIWPSWHPQGGVWPTTSVVGPTTDGQNTIISVIPCPRSLARKHSNGVMTQTFHFIIWKCLWHEIVFLLTQLTIDLFTSTLLLAVVKWGLISLMM